MLPSPTVTVPRSWEGAGDSIIRSAPRPALWYTAVLVCVLLNMLDGFDVLVISIVSPAIAAAWALNGQQLGLLFSAGVAGMVVGSLVLAPAADRLGRRRIVLAGILLDGIGMGLSSLCSDYQQLSACRFLTGLGIGAILASAMVLVSEYAPAHRKTTASFLYTAGYSLGATVGGAAAAAVVERWGWPSAFRGGALGSALLLPIALRYLPESESYRRAQFAAAAGHAQPPTGWTALLPSALFRDRATTTILVWLGFFCAYAGYYFVFSWTPKLLVTQGLSARAGMNAGVILSVGGLIGTLLFAVLGQRVAVHRILLMCLGSSVLVMLSFPSIVNGASMALAITAVLGAATTSAMASFYALTPRLYEPLVRTAGMGWAVGVGRFGAIVAPLLTGMLIDRGWKALGLFTLFGLCFALAGVASLALARSRPLGVEEPSRVSTGALPLDPVP